MSNSALVNYKRISPNKDCERNHVIDTITIHHMAGNMSVEAAGELFANPTRNASSNYGIGSDGRIALYVDECDRAWTSGNADNDNRAITIEVANDGGADTDWHVSDLAYSSLVKLCIDICQRNGIKKLLWKNDPSLVGQVDKQNMTVHRWFQSTACPGTYLMSVMGQIAEDVNRVISPTNYYRVQVGAFAVKENAEKMVQKLYEAGFEDAFIFETNPSEIPMNNEDDEDDGIISIGDKVKIVYGASDYNDRALAAFAYDRVYDVVEINNFRVVIAYEGVIFAAMHIKDLYLA